MAEQAFAARHAARLLADIGVHGLEVGTAPHPAVAWAESGLGACTGLEHAPGLMAPAPVAAAADGAMLALRALVPGLTAPGGNVLLGERARLLRLPARGAVSAGGTCRLLRTRSGMLAVNLARPEDWAALPAWLECDMAPDWPTIAAVMAARDGGELVRRAALLGLAVAEAPSRPAAGAWLSISAEGPPAPPPRRLRVIDLSALWAGPLCGRLLLAAGAEVIKVESRARPDGARSGDADVFARLNGGKWCVGLDFSRHADLVALRGLIARADIVIDSARPRAMAQLGLAAAECVRATPGLVWVSITGYGRDGAAADRVGFGDDTAAAAGLCGAMRAAYGAMMFCGDAIADPLTGLHAAVAAVGLRRRGGGVVAALSLQGVVADILSADRLAGPLRRQRTRRWGRLARRVPPAPLPRGGQPAAAWGAHTRDILAAWAA